MNELHQLATRHRQLVEMIVAERNWRMSLRGDAQNDIEVTVRFLKDRLKQVNARLAALIEKNAEWKQRAELLMNSVPGVGPVLISIMIAELPELGTTKRKQIAALVGVAPCNNDSGKSQGRRHVWGGRAHLRALLYMSVVAGLRFNPMVSGFYQHLRQAGKPACASGSSSSMPWSDLIRPGTHIFLPSNLLPRRSSRCAKLSPVKRQWQQPFATQSAGI